MYAKKFNKYISKLKQSGGGEIIYKLILFENVHVNKMKNSENTILYTIHDKHYNIIENMNIIIIENIGKINIMHKCADLLYGHFEISGEITDDVKIILFDIMESLNLTLIESDVQIFDDFILFKSLFIYLNSKHNLHHLIKKVLINYNDELGISNDQYVKESEETKKYSINLLWIFKNKLNYCLSFMNDIPYNFNSRDNIQHFIDTDESVQKIILWSHMNPAGKVNFWIDTNLLDAHTIINMKIIFYILNEMYPHKIYLKDLHKLRTTNEINIGYHNVFNGEDGFITPIYFRVDLYKAILLLEELKNCVTYAVVLDMDMIPQSNEILFSENTLKSLNTVGFVMAGGLREKYENGFQILGSENPKIKEIIIDAINKILIKMNVVLCNYLISKKILTDESYSSYIDSFSQNIYASYRFMFKYIFYKLEKGYLLYRPCYKIDDPDYFFAEQSDKIIKITNDNEHIIFNDDQALSNNEDICSIINRRSYFIDIVYDSDYFKLKNEFNVAELGDYLESIQKGLFMKSINMFLPPENLMDVSRMMPPSALNFSSR